MTVRTERLLEALRESEERFRATFEQAAVGIAFTAPDGRMLQVNQRLCDFYGYRREELFGKAFQDITHPDDLHADLDGLHRLLAGAVPSYSLEKRYIRKDGSPIWGTLTVSLVRAPSGDPKYTVAIVEDITERKRAEEALRRSEERLTRIIETNAEGLLIVERSGRYSLVNAAAERILGMTRDEILRRTYDNPPWRYITVEGDPLADDERPIRRVLQTGESVHDVEHALVRPDGSQIVLSVNVAPLRDDDGRVTAVIASFMDVTARVRAQRDVRQTEGRLRAIVENAAIGISMTDLEGRISSANPALLRMVGYAAEELRGMSFAAFTHPDDVAADMALLGELIAGKRDSYQLEKRYIRKDRSEVWVRLTVSLSPAARDEPPFVVALVEDISERKRAEAALEHQALHDTLTDLPNRTLLHDRLEQALLAARRGGTPLALLLMDLDRFKEINDTFGHHHGDLLLQQLGPRLRGILREVDTVGRLGGDEFGILLPATDGPGAALSARKVLRALHQPFSLEDRWVDIGASIGIALFPDHGDDATALLRRADVAMYLAKRNESGYAVYAAEHDQYSPNRIALMGDLREAIERDFLFLEYQPKIDLRTTRADSVEALVRWKHPQRGTVRPDEFIHLAQHGGLLKPLGVWVLNAALAQCRSWHDDGYEVSVAVNVSPRSLHDLELIETIEALLRRWDAQPCWLVVEITESAIMVDAGRALDTLTALHAMGVRVSIDDFGTGYSSLAYLRHLPVDEVKIDQTFVSGMLTHGDDAAIVRSVVDLGHNLGLEVVAEGVENRHVLRALQQIGCDYAQGYHLGAPMPWEALAQHLGSVHALCRSS